MIHIIHGFDAKPQPLLESMFADRKRLFVDLLDWDVPIIDGRYEIDGYDGANAVYVVAEGAGVHVGSLRLLPTITSHLLGDQFAALCPMGVPHGPDIFEITRLCLPQRLGAEGRRLVRNALISAMVDHALCAGITRLTGVVEAGFRREVLAMGWLAEPLGPALRIGRAELGAFQLHIDASTPARLAWTGICSSAVFPVPATPRPAEEAIVVHAHGARA